MFTVKSVQKQVNFDALRPIRQTLAQLQVFIFIPDMSTSNLKSGYYICE